LKTTAKASHQKFKEQLMMFWQGTVSTVCYRLFSTALMLKSASCFIKP